MAQVRTTYQNIPGTWDLPPRPPRDFIALPAAHQGLYWVGVLLVILGIVAGGAAVLNEPTGVPPEVVRAGGVVLAILGIGTSIVAVAAGRRSLVRQQLRYYAWAQVPPATPRDLAAMQVWAFRTLPDWTETLEMEPLERLVAHVPNARKRLSTMRVMGGQAYREWLDEWWSITDAESCRSRIESLWQGLHSLSFATTPGDAPEIATAMRLMGMSRDEVLARRMPGPAGRPPLLLWAWDLGRTVEVARYGFSAGYLSRDEAWAAIHRASDAIHALFGSFDEYVVEYCLGLAYWGASEQRMRSTHAEVDAYVGLHAGWPVRTAPWVHGGTLPPHILDGLADARRQRDAELWRRAGL